MLFDGEHMLVRSVLESSSLAMLRFIVPSYMASLALHSRLDLLVELVKTLQTSKPVAAHSRLLVELAQKAAALQMTLPPHAHVSVLGMGTTCFSFQHVCMPHRPAISCSNMHAACFNNIRS